MELKELKQKSKALEPCLRIGKSGLTESVINEVKAQLKRRKLIKLKLLKSCLDGSTKDILKKRLVEETGAKLISSIGFIIVLHKEK